MLTAPEDRGRGLPVCRDTDSPLGFGLQQQSQMKSLELTVECLTSLQMLRPTGEFLGNPVGLSGPEGDLHVIRHLSNVNCWFCNENTQVPKYMNNCWDCPNCRQYNGFQEDGNYNKVIPSQHDQQLNRVFCSGREPSDELPPQPQAGLQMALCQTCNKNQAAKLQLLASFTPKKEANYDKEIRVFRHHVEQLYELCRPCKSSVDGYIRDQDKALFTYLRHRYGDTTGKKPRNMQSSGRTSSSRAPLRGFVGFLAIVACVFLVSSAALDFKNLFTSSRNNLLPPSVTPAPNSILGHDEHQSFGVKSPGSTKETFEHRDVLESFDQSDQLEALLLFILAFIVGVILDGFGLLISRSRSSTTSTGSG